MGRAPGKAERTDRRGRVGDEAVLELRIGPGLGDNAGADMRPDPGLVGLDDEIERLGIDITLLRQDRLQRPHPKLHLGQLGAVVVAVVVIIVVGVLMYGHEANLARPDLLDYAARTTDVGTMAALPRNAGAGGLRGVFHEIPALGLPSRLPIMRPSFADVLAPHPCPVSHCLLPMHAHNICSNACLAPPSAPGG